MIFKDFINEMQALLLQYPELENLPVCLSSDDEGNRISEFTGDWGTSDLGWDEEENNKVFILWPGTEIEY